MSERVELPIGMSRRGKAERGTFRVVSLEEIVAAPIGWTPGGPRSSPPFGTAYYLSHKHGGRAVAIRSNGMVKRWIREPSRFEWPVKYGMYECFTIDNREIADGRLLVRVD